jgi:hypothetical protein
MRRAATFGEGPIASQWASLDAALLAWGALHLGANRKNLPRIRLAHFMHWCASSGIPAEFVDDEVVDRYMYENHRVKTKSHTHRRDNTFRRNWNYAVCIVPGWPAAWLTPLTPRRELPTILGETIISFAECDFHPSLVAEIDLYCSRGGFLDEEREALASLDHRGRLAARVDKFKQAPAAAILAASRRRPERLGEDAVYGQRRLIFRTATALYLAGVANIENLRSIRDVVTPLGAAVLADTLQERRTEKSYVGESVRRLMQIALRCGIAFAAAEYLALRELRLDVGLPSHLKNELSEKNLSRLLQFDDADRFAMLIALPDALIQEAESERRRKGGYATRKMARKVRAATAIEILNALPVRLGSLLSLDIQRNFVVQRNAPPTMIFYPGQVKNRRALEARLSARTWALISLYCEHYRPLLQGADQSTLLIPGQRGKSPSPGIFARTTCRFVTERLGVQMNINLWRHLLGTKVAELREQTEDAGRLLGHSPGSGSTGTYVRVGTRLAAKWLREITDEVRPHGIELLRRRRPSYRRGRKPRG